MVTRLAAERVFEVVSARFAVEASDVKLLFGWRKPSSQLEQGVGRANQVVFVPGDGDSAGDYLPGVRYPGALSRTIRTMVEPITIYCWAFDGTDSATANSQLAQWRACRLLLDATIRACDLALRELSGLNSQRPFSKPQWVFPDTDRTFGCSCKFVLTLTSTVPDELPDLSGPPRVEITNQVLTLDVEIAKSDDDPGELDPPPLTPEE